MAMVEELYAINRDWMWQLCSLPSNKKTNNLKRVFKTKCDDHGNIQLHKSCLVVQGYSQQPGIHYEKTFSPSLKYSNLSCFIDLTTMENSSVLCQICCL